MKGSIVQNRQWPLQGTVRSNRFFDNASGHAETFERCSKQMFIDGDCFELEACFADSSGCKAEKLTNLKGLELYLEEVDNGISVATASGSATQLFFIHQKNSRAEMLILKEAILLILSRIQVFPFFINILSRFELRTKESYTSTNCMSPFYSRNELLGIKDSIFETTYTLKHVEINNRHTGTNQWSIRQQAIYQHFCTSSQTSSNILIQTSDQVQKRIRELSKDGSIGSLSHHWTYIHEVYLGTLGHDWATFLQSINLEVGSSDLYYFTTAKGEDSVQPTFENIQSLHHWIDVLSDISKSLQTNVEVLGHLSDEATRRATLDDAPETYVHFQDILRTTAIEQQFLKQQSDYVRGFAERRAGQLRDAIALRDSNAMMALNHKTVRETQTMRAITLVALIYLPASFTATFLGMGYVSVTSVKGSLKVSASRDLWFYFAITAPLMVFTFLVWVLWELHIRRRARKRAARGEESEKPKDV